MAETPQKNVRLIHRDGIPYLIKMELRYDIPSNQKVWKKKKGPGLHPLRMTSVEATDGTIGHLAVDSNNNGYVIDPANGRSHKLSSRYSKLNFV